MVIGIDFDNTIICYDEVFYREAVQHGWIHNNFPRNKKLIRDYIWRTKGDNAWQRLQAIAYGQKINDALLIKGVKDFLFLCRDKGIRVYIVSHKTEYADNDPYRTNLREAAIQWMEYKGFFNGRAPCLSRQDIFFEITRLDKINRIKELGCTLFIDDLEEIFTEKIFDKGIGKILYSPLGYHEIEGVKICRNWMEITDHVFRNHEQAG